MHFKVSAVLPTDARTYLIERDSAALHAFVMQTQNLGASDIQEHWSNGDAQNYRLATLPDTDHFVPKQLREILPKHLECTLYGFTPYGHAHPRTIPFVQQIYCSPPVAAQKTKMECTLTINAINEAQCRQTLEGDICVSIAGVGPIAERIVCTSLQDTYAQLPDVIQRWCRFRDQVVKQPGGQELLLQGSPSSEKDWLAQEVRQLLRTPYRSSAAAFVTSAAQPDTADGAALIPAGLPQLQQQQQGQGQQQGQQSPAQQQQRDAAVCQQHEGSPSCNAVSQVQQQDEARCSGALSGETWAVGDLAGDLAGGTIDCAETDACGRIDDATAAELREDEMEAAQWFNSNGQHPQGVDHETDSVLNTPGANEGSQFWAGGSRCPPRVEAHAEACQAAAINGGRSSHKGPCLPIGNVTQSAISGAQNLSAWQEYWMHIGVAQQRPVQAAVHRLIALYGIAVRHGLEQPIPELPNISAHPASQTQKEVPAGNEVAVELPWSEANMHTPKRTNGRPVKTVAFESPLVNGIHEAQPAASDTESEDSQPRFCFGFSKWIKRFDR